MHANGDRPRDVVLDFCGDALACPVGMRPNKVLGSNHKGATVCAEHSLHICLARNAFERRLSNQHARLLVAYRAVLKKDDMTRFLSDSFLARSIHLVLPRSSHANTNRNRANTAMPTLQILDARYIDLKKFVGHCNEKFGEGKWQYETVVWLPSARTWNSVNITNTW
jgi:hypothetical protein